MPNADPPRPRLLCLCAAWCHLCTDYAPLFAAVGQRLRADWPQLTSRWIDIEDEAELVGDLDVPTFPTVVVLHGTRVLFHGALPPQAEVLERVVRGLLEAPADSADAVQEPEVAAFAQRLGESAP
jgi:thioredoxin-like negative regulator of GroEL